MNYKILDKKLPPELRDYIFEYVMPSKKDVMKKHKDCMEELMLNFAFKRFDSFIILGGDFFLPIIYRIYHSTSNNLI
jgi:hypothetical protein